jgi:hypothetical protein
LKAADSGLTKLRILFLGVRHPLIVMTENFINSKTTMGAVTIHFHCRGWRIVLALTGFKTT